MKSALSLIRPVADSGKGYWPALDGIRAISVVAVIGVHSGLRLAHAGGFGVQIFFVLSGFLITTLLLAEFRHYGRIDLAGFYMRRALRLLPALALFLVVCTLLVLPAGAPFRSQTLRAIPFAVFYSYNWVQALADPPYGLVTHTWSLAVEEQFYLVWPLLVIGILRLARSPRAVVLAAGFGVVASIVWTAVLWASTHNVARVNYGSDTAVTPLMLGALVAGIYTSVQWSPSARRWIGRLGAVGFAVMVGGLLKSFPPGIEFTGAQAAIEVATAVAVLGLVTAPFAPIEALLKISPLVLVGRISYGVYLWQGPVMMLLVSDTRIRGWGLLGVGLVMTIAIAAASYVLVETRFLELKKRLRRRSSETVQQAAVAARAG